MPVIAIKAHVTTKAQAAGAPKPKCQATHAEKMPVASSTAGYRAEILVLHVAQRPRNISQLMTGMFCHALIGVLQFGQAEPGVTKLNRAPGVLIVEVGVGVGVGVAVVASTSAAWDCQSRSNTMGNR